AIEQEPEVAACAVVPIETANGPEPCAVLAVRGAGEHIAEAVERANARLAEFQRVRRWVLWPEPDLPRTSTGKVRRKAVAAWLALVEAAAAGDLQSAAANFSPSGDWLLALIKEIAGEAPPGVGDDLRLSEDLHLDSLGRVQLEAALEERLGMTPAGGEIDQARTLGDLRKLVAGDGVRGADSASVAPPGAAAESGQGQGPSGVGRQTAEEPQGAANQPVVVGLNSPQEAGREKYIYPHWQWWMPVAWVRTVFLEAIAQPLVRLLASPRVVKGPALLGEEPMLIICNHVTAYDGPLVEYALPGPMRRRMAVAMSGEMLEDFRHFRNPERAAGRRRFMLFGPAAYLLLTALYNVFPLPRRRDFQRSFAHAGEALDRGLNVLVFPEGTRSEAGKLARFQPGIGMLTKQSGTAVLPVAIRGLGELKAGQKRWFRSGRIEVRVGQPVRFAPEVSEAEITARLHAEVERLLQG
ncbi:MAG: 1-acyl-sn-glycerol-3-phosphate acyltransferase, partial [Terracidiphilus sp.]